MTGVFPQRSSVDSWSRGAQYVGILTRGAIWRVWSLKAYTSIRSHDTQRVLFYSRRSRYIMHKKNVLSKRSIIVSYNKTDIQHCCSCNILFFIHCPKGQTTLHEPQCNISILFYNSRSLFGHTAYANGPTFQVVLSKISPHPTHKYCSLYNNITHIYQI